MKRVLRYSFALLGVSLFLFATTAPDVSAQEKKSKTVYKMEHSENGETTVIIKDENGKITVNGRELKEGEDVQDYLPEGVTLEGGVGGDVDVLVFDDEDGKRKKRIRRKHGPDFEFFGDGENEFEFEIDDLDFGGFEGLVDMPRIMIDGLSRAPKAVGDGMFFFSHADALMNPEIREMERQSRELARKARSAEGDERDKLERELDDLLQELFDVKQDYRTEKMEELKAKVAEMEADAQERRANRDEIISRRKSQLLGEKDQLDW